jgi:hypothetical protein
MDKIKHFLNNDTLFFRVVILGILLAMLAMFSCLNDSIDRVQDDVRISILGQYNTTCTVDKSGTHLICSIPDYNYLETMLKRG